MTALRERAAHHGQSMQQEIHDANVVATMLVHGIGTVVTGNVGDFARFGGHVSVVGLHR